MLMALFMWLLGLVGVAPEPAALEQMQNDFFERGHHVGIEFGGTFMPDQRSTTIGLRYEYFAARRFNAVSFEVVGEVIFNNGIIDAMKREGDQYYYVGAGLGYYPITSIKLYMSAGPSWRGGDPAAAGRVGIGYRFPFFMLSVMPTGYIQTDTNGVLTGLVGVWIEY
jgi:hypothetical protein